jgi:hypothetical protein
LQEKLIDGNRITYEEWEGFVDFSEKEKAETLKRILSDPPLVFVLVINCSQKVKHSQYMQLCWFMYVPTFLPLAAVGKRLLQPSPP